MKFTVAIDCYNAAFDAMTEEDGFANGCEIARILRSIAQDVDDIDIGPGWGKTLHDINGNRVGTAELED